jgi:hypothetical protein
LEDAVIKLEKSKIKRGAGRAYATSRVEYKLGKGKSLGHEGKNEERTAEEA